MAEEYARESNVTLEKTDHPRLKFMSKTGCTVPPHMRPLCTFHVCSINGFGFKPNDPAWTEKYYKLREEIDQYEATHNTEG